MKRKNIVLKALTCSIASLAFTACTDIWDSHYQPKPELNATETLWDHRPDRRGNRRRLALVTQLCEKSSTPEDKIKPIDSF